VAGFIRKAADVSLGVPVEVKLNTNCTSCGVTVWLCDLAIRSTAESFRLLEEQVRVEARALSLQGSPATRCRLLLDPVLTLSLPCCRSTWPEGKL
jgi:hypothetical protein